MLTFLVKTLIDFSIMMLLLRIWMQWTHCDFYNPFSQCIIKITQPVIGILRQIIPSRGALDTASLLLVFILAMIKFPLLTVLEMRVIFIDSSYLLIGLLAMIKAIGELIFWVVIIRSLLSWVSQGHSPIDMIFYQLSESLMHPMRCIFPPMGGIDFSAMIVILILYILNYLSMDLFPEIMSHL
ncbi:YggT family protein [Candidatus Steffania adelgidicola]|uniref:YggT family protein n=1 Tax=Candidatus Steffania adelgidicola TaxID=1076626 RepID=UPI001D02B2FA|nr:YggT family protein [Candidatus Steffania adelgidicola]UDG80012.1 hypothetical protein GFK82_00565 [Candidatus Steffania adelgidicola]